VKKLEGPIGLILCPTRELCQQVYVEVKRYARLYDVKVAGLVGGEDKQQQWMELRNGVDIIVATPGRLLDLYKKKATNFKRCSFLIVDEADKMFSLGFDVQIKSILGQIRPEKQILLFSATFNKKVRDLCEEFLNDPVQIIVGKQNQANEDIKQEFVIFTSLEDKLEWMLDNVPLMLKKGKVLVFVNHIKSCNDMEKIFNEFEPDIPKVVIHGDKMQHERTGIISQFKKNVDLMIATDVASRGLDIHDIKFVINYENPKDGDIYVHRIGRTGRAGNKDGVAITLLMRTEVHLQ
jgi:ATP-dependent RNA helicase DDX42